VAADEPATVSAYANSALMATSAVSYILFCVPLFEILGVQSISLGCEFAPYLGPPWSEV
jgi:hypothetical protein